MNQNFSILLTVDFIELMLSISIIYNRCLRNLSTHQLFGTRRLILIYKKAGNQNAGKNHHYCLNHANENLSYHKNNLQKYFFHLYFNIAPLVKVCIFFTMHLRVYLLRSDPNKKSARGGTSLKLEIRQETYSLNRLCLLFPIPNFSAKHICLSLSTVFILLKRPPEHSFTRSKLALSAATMSEEQIIPISSMIGS
jgi:hypothetical protein